MKTNNKLQKVENEWLHNLAYLTQIVVKKSDINIQHGKLLYSLVSNLDKKIENLTILETGTARGFSSICMSKALNNNNRKGTIYTIDFLPNNKKMYWNCVSDLDGKKTRVELLKDYTNEIENIKFIEGFSKNVLKKINLDHINFAFLDGSHKYKDVKIEFSYVSQRQIVGDQIFFDDFTPGTFDGIVKLIHEIEKENKYELDKIFSSDKRGYVLATKK